MKITIEHEDTICTIENKDVVDIWEASQLVKQALVGVGYHPENVDDLFREDD